MLKRLFHSLTMQHGRPDHEGEQAEPDEPLIAFLSGLIRLTVRILAILMTAVILWGMLDVVWVIYERLKTRPFGLLTISDILATFGAFMAVLIAIEIFINIAVYLRKDVIHVKIVMATALMAIARKIIILDTDDLEVGYLYGLAAILLAMSELPPILRQKPGQLKMY